MKNLAVNTIKNIIFIVFFAALTSNTSFASCGLKYEPLPESTIKISVEKHPKAEWKQYLVKIDLPKEYNGYPITELSFYGVVSGHEGYYFQSNIALNKEEKKYSSWLLVNEEFLEGSYIEVQYVYKEHKQCPRYYRKFYIKESHNKNQSNQEH